MFPIIPSRLVLPKIFESVSRYAQEDGGWRLLSADLSLEQQMEFWVRSTGNLITGLGQISISVQQNGCEQAETRIIALAYVPAIEYPEHPGTLNGQEKALKPESASVFASRFRGGAADFRRVISQPTTTITADAGGAAAAVPGAADQVSAAEP